MIMVRGKYKCVVEVVIVMMKIGESLKRNGNPMKIIGKKKIRKTDNKGEGFTKERKHQSRKKT